MTTELDSMLSKLADLVADRVVDRLRAGDAHGWIDQGASPLGARRHCALARRLLAAGDQDATRVGRRWLVRRERLDAELVSGAGRKRTRTDDLAAELGLRVIGGGR